MTEISLLSKSPPFSKLGIAFYWLARKMSSNQPVGVSVLFSVCEEKRSINKHSQHSNYFAFASFKLRGWQEGVLGLVILDYGMWVERRKLSSMCPVVHPSFPPHPHPLPSSVTPLLLLLSSRQRNLSQKRCKERKGQFSFSRGIFHPLKKGPANLFL